MIIWAAANRLQLSALLACLLAVAPAVKGCWYSEDRYLRRAVTAEEVVGVWLMNPNTVEDLRDVGYEDAVNPYEHKIVLRPEGVCHFKTVLVSREFKQLNAACRWSLEGGGKDHQTLDLEIDADQTSPVHTFYYFDQNQLDGRLVLWRHITDPDMWRYVEYSKVLDSPVE